MTKLNFNVSGVIKGDRFDKDGLSERLTFFVEQALTGSGEVLDLHFQVTEEEAEPTGAYSMENPFQALKEKSFFEPVSAENGAGGEKKSSTSKLLAPRNYSVVLWSEWSEIDGGLVSVPIFFHDNTNEAEAREALSNQGVEFGDLGTIRELYVYRGWYFYRVEGNEAYYIDYMRNTAHKSSIDEIESIIDSEQGVDLEKRWYHILFGTFDGTDGQYWEDTESANLNIEQLRSNGSLTDTELGEIALLDKGETFSGHNIRVTRID